MDLCSISSVFISAVIPRNQVKERCYLLALGEFQVFRALAVLKQPNVVLSKKVVQWAFLIFDPNDIVHSSKV